MIRIRYILTLMYSCTLSVLTGQDTIRDYPVWTIPEGAVKPMSMVKLQELRLRYEVYPAMDTLADTYRCSWSDIGREEKYTVITKHPGDSCQVFVYRNKMGLGFVGKDLPKDEPRYSIGAWRAIPTD